MNTVPTDPPIDEEHSGGAPGEPAAGNRAAELGDALDQAIARGRQYLHGYRDAVTSYRSRTVIGHLDGVPQLGDIFDGYGIVHYATRYVIDTSPRGANSADEIDRAHAAVVLDRSPWEGRLTPRERMAVLRRFPEVVDDGTAEAAHARLVEALERKGERDRARGYTTCPRCCATGPAAALGMSDRAGVLRVPLCSWCSGEVLASATSVDARRWLR